MKTKNKIMRNIIGILLVSSSFIHSQNVDPYQFFPTNIGDRWEYTQAGPDVIYTVVRDSIDMKDSSRFVFFYDPPLYYGANYRIDKKYNVFYLPQFDNLHEYKLDARVDEWWLVGGGTAAKVLDISQMYVFGKITTVKTIGFYTLAPGDTVINENSRLDNWDRLAYGFGLISNENGATQPYLLRGCRINGVTYGTVDVEEESHSIPSEFVLYQNYPNPFNPTTNIKFSLPKYSNVRLTIYDALGREVETLVSNKLAAGIYNIEWTAKNMASGIYFYRIEAENSVKCNLLPDISLK